MILSNVARKNCSVGEIVNIMSVNVQSLNDLAYHINMAWSCVFVIIVGTWLIWQQLGVASLAGLFVMVIMAPVNVFISNRVKRLQMKRLKETDGRVKTTNELLNGIKMVKFYAWEIPFWQLIEKFRNAEVRILRNISYFSIITNITWVLTPFLVSAVSFGMFTLLNSSSVLTAQSTFVSLSLFNVLQQPMSMIPINISNLIQVKCLILSIRNAFKVKLFKKPIFFNSAY